MIIRISLLIIGYLFGLIQNGYYYSKSKGIDITHKGSGNVGATNVLRSIGVKTGVIVFILDMLKGLVPCLVVKLLFNTSGAADIYVLYIGFGVLLGHCFPAQLGFKGGKGISSAFGMILVYDYRIALIILAVFLILVVITKYVSLGSSAAAIVFPVASILIKKPATEEIVLILIMIAIVLYRHSSNIKRLFNRTENKISFKESKENPVG